MAVIRVNPYLRCLTPADHCGKHEQAGERHVLAADSALLHARLALAGPRNEDSSRDSCQKLCLLGIAARGACSPAICGVGGCVTGSCRAEPHEPLEVVG